MEDTRAGLLRRWRPLLAAITAIAAAAVPGEAGGTFTTFASHGPVAGKAVAAAGAVAFTVLAFAATSGSARRAHDALAARAGRPQASAARTAILAGGTVITLIVTLGLLHVPVGQLVLGGTILGILTAVAAQEALGNLFAGLVLMLARPLAPGRKVRVYSGTIGDHDGTVLEVGLTFVLMDTPDGWVRLPNTQVLGAAVTGRGPARGGNLSPQGGNLTAPARRPGHRGRLPVKPPGEKFPLRYVHEYAREPFPPPTYPVDVSAGITDWLMLGNGPDPSCTTHPDGVGDCTFAGRQHLRMCKAAAYHETEQWETSDSLVAEYLAYNHGKDVGANIADLLLAWYRAGKILAFAPVDHRDPAQVDAAMAAFRGVYCGVSLTDDADDLFGRGEPWTVAGGQRPDPAEGHCIVKIAADGRELDEWVTWGARQSSTRGWTAACVDEAWAVATSEDELAHIDSAALTADIDALGGGTPAPSPAPGDPHGLLAELAGLVREVAADGDRSVAEVVAWLRSHGL